MLRTQFSVSRGRALICGVALSALMAGVAQAQAPSEVVTPTAQPAPPPPTPAGAPETLPTAGAPVTSGAASVSEVVVTGTLIRGVAPAGSEVLSVTAADVLATGATSTDQLLQSVPQISNLFAELPRVGTTPATQFQVNTPSLRDLPGSQSGSSTLILMDGHRLVGEGITQDTPDPDVIPPSVIERVEIVPDGGSSIYGADAVGGVINFITKRHISGVTLDVHGGGGDDYSTIDSDLLAGKDWGTGSAYLALDYSHNSPIAGNARDYVRTIDFTTGIPTGRQCDLANINVGGVFYAEPGRQPNTFNACDTNRQGDLYPEQSRGSVFAGISQDFGSKIKMDIRGYFSDRDTRSASPLTGSTSVGPTNPYYQNVTGTGDTQNVQFDFNPVAPNGQIQKSNIKSWGISPTLTADLPFGWQFRGLINYGGSETNFFNSSINPDLLTEYGAGTTAATAIDPYNIAATSNSQLVSNLLDYDIEGKAEETLVNARTVFEGPLFSLPGGQVRLAVGAEFIHNGLQVKSTGAGGLPGYLSSVPYADYDQDVGAAFGELQVPLVGPNNRLPGVYSLSVSGSGRFDHYSDFGSTTNPKVGITYRPLSWMTLRSTYSTSFQAPTPIDELGSQTSAIGYQNFYVPEPNGSFNTSGAYAVALTGSAPNLQPQTSKQYTVGSDFIWPFATGLTSSVNYYNISYQGLLSKPPIFAGPLFFNNYKNYYILSPTNAQLEAYAAQVNGGLAALAPILAPGSAINVYELLDYRTYNIGFAKTAGLDFSSQYVRPTSFGSADLSVSGNYEFYNYTVVPGSGPSSNLAAGPTTRFRLSATAGVNVGYLRAQVTLNHLEGFNVTPDASLPQTHVSDFNLVNLYFKYDLHTTGLLSNSFVTLNVDNIADANPPLYEASGLSGYTNGMTLGRVVQVGFHHTF